MKIHSMTGYQYRMIIFKKILKLKQEVEESSGKISQMKVK